MRGKQRRWTDEQLADAVVKSRSYSDVIRHLGMRPAGGNHATVKRHAARLALDTTHFTDESRLRGLRLRHDRHDLTRDQIFREGSTVVGESLRRHARNCLAPIRCALCDNAGQWQGRPLTLQLDHANGRYDDNRLENLRWLCPNCHSQTPTFAGRGNARRVREAPAFYSTRRDSPRAAVRRSPPR